MLISNITEEYKEVVKELTDNLIKLDSILCSGYNFLFKYNAWVKDYYEAYFVGLYDACGHTYYCTEKKTRIFCITIENTRNFHVVCDMVQYVGGTIEAKGGKIMWYAYKPDDVENIIRIFKKYPPVSTKNRIELDKLLLVIYIKTESKININFELYGLAWFLGYRSHIGKSNLHSQEIPYEGDDSIYHHINNLMSRYSFIRGQFLNNWIFELQYVEERINKLGDYLYESSTDIHCVNYDRLNEVQWMKVVLEECPLYSE